MHVVSSSSGPVSPSETQTPPPALVPLALRVTQQDVARAAGVHNSTVSLALRGSSTISDATRDRVRHLAAEMGYAPDPAVQALVAYRNRLSRKSVGAAIAFVTNEATEHGWRSNPASEAYFLGAQERAAGLGYRLDHFWAGAAGLSPRRLSQILFHRGIAGVLLLAQGSAAREWQGMDWNQLSAVAIGHRDMYPGVHRVTSDPSGHVRLAFRRAFAAGYRRIGVVLPRTCDEESEGAWAQAVVAEQSRVSSHDAVPTFPMRGEQDAYLAASRRTISEIEIERLSQWMRGHRPEVIISWEHWIRPCLSALGLSVPRDIALVDLDRANENPGSAGVKQNHRAVGSVGVERVVQYIQQNLRGMPAIPTRTLIEGVWCDGASLPRLSAPLLRRPSFGTDPSVDAQVSTVWSDADPGNRCACASVSV